jgi:predicted nucleotidyltransferase
MPARLDDPGWQAALPTGTIPRMNRPQRPEIPPFDELRDTVSRIARERRFRLVVLFGSVARGELGAEDLDLAILHDEPLDLIELTNVFTVALRMQEVDLCALRHADPLLAALVARDGVPLWESRPHEFDRFALLAARRYADTHKFREAEHEELHERIERLRR